MVHKLALGVGALAAIAVLALAMGAGSLAARPARAEGVVVPGAPTANATPATRTQVDTVYVKPVPKQRVVHVTRTTNPAKPTKASRVVTVAARPHGDENDENDEGRGDGERDGGD